eukprot:UN08536
MTYFVPPAETNWLFTTKNLQALSSLCSGEKRPRITTRKVRKCDLPQCPSLLDLSKNHTRCAFQIKEYYLISPRGFTLSSIFT